MKRRLSSSELASSLPRRQLADLAPLAPSHFCSALISTASTDSPSKKPRPTSLVLVLGEGGTGSSSEEAPLSSTAGPGNKKKLVIKDGGERKPRGESPAFSSSGPNRD